MQDMIEIYPVKLQLSYDPKITKALISLREYNLITFPLKVLK